MPESDQEKVGQSQNQKTDEEVSHDKLFGKAIPLFLKSWIELLHPDIAPNLDLDHVEFLTEKLFADLRKEGHIVPDMVARTSTRSGEPSLVLLHHENERRFTKEIDERMEGYIMMLTAKYHCAVISSVVFLSGGEAGLVRRELIREVDGWECSRVAYLSLGLSKSLAEDWVDKPQVLAPALAALMRSKVWDRVEQKLHCLQAISRADVGSKERFTLATIVETYLKLDPEEEDRFQAEIESDDNKEVRDMVVTWDEAIAASEDKGREEGREEGRKEGRKEGRNEGRREGREDATRQAIILLLKHNCGSVPDEVMEKLNAISELSRLYEILEQAMDVRSIDELDL